jgi:hypothetical protein
MGDKLDHRGWVTFQIRLPKKIECILFKDGKLPRTWQNHGLCTYITAQPDIYRVEANIDHLGMKRGWIFSNLVNVM